MSEKELLAIGEFLNTQGYGLDLTEKNGFWLEEYNFSEHKVRDIAKLLQAYANEFYIPKEEHEAVSNMRDRFKEKYEDFNSEIQKLKEENERLKFMIENGLGWEDIRNDIEYPTGE